MSECKDCGEEINEKRVKAMPNVKTCIDCQQDMEKNGRFRLHKLDVQSKTRCGEIDVTEQTLVRGTT